MMQDLRNQIPSSPTTSSISSSDLDTESTGSFFHDRSITLGTLMGFSFTAMPIQFRASSHHHVSPSVAISRASTSNARRHQRKRLASNSAEHHRRRKWWRFCRDEDDYDAGNGIQRGIGDSKRSSLGEYLEVERRFGEEAIYGSAEVELEGAVARYREQQPVLAERALFVDGRVLPPASAEGEGTPVATTLCRFPVSLTGICSGGG